MQAIELAASRGWSQHPADGVRAHRRSRCTRSTTCGPPRPREHLEHASAAAARAAPPPAGLRDRPPRRAHAAARPARRARPARARRLRGAAPPPRRLRRRHEQVSIGRDARAAADRGRRARGGRGDGSRRSRTSRGSWSAPPAARLALARGEPADAVEVLERFVDREAIHAVSPVEARALLAIAHDEAGEPRQGRSARSSRRSRWPRRTATAGRSWSSGAAWRSCCAPDPRAAPRTARSSASCWTRSPTARRSRATSAPLLEPLSDREQAILRYLPTALSNREIAAELFVTTNTVKTHLR